MGTETTELGSLEQALNNLDDMDTTEECDYCDDKNHWKKERDYRPEKGVTKVTWYCRECGELVKERKIPRALR